MFVEIENLKNVTESEFAALKDKVVGFEIEKDTDLEWLLTQAEEFCSWRAVRNALFKSIQIAEGKDKKLDRGAIPDILSSALAVSFDSNIGHDFTEDWELRYETYHDAVERVPFDIELLNKITRGGAPKKTLTVFMGATGIGKTMVMCHLTSANLTMGKNVLYLTMEMGEVGEPSISQRIDANLLDTSIDDLMLLPFDTYKNRIEIMRQKIIGKLIIKQYPMGSPSVNNFKFLMRELKLKKGFVPDVVYVDYINICASARMKRDEGSYFYIKSITEELCGFAQEYNLPVISATQLNRKGSESSEPTKTDVAESYGLTNPADLIIAITQSDIMRPLNQFQFIQVKNRYGDEDRPRKFVVGVDKSKARLYNVDQIAQTLDQGTNVVKQKFGFDKDAFLNFK